MNKKVIFIVALLAVIGLLFLHGGLKSNTKTDSMKTLETPNKFASSTSKMEDDAEADNESDELRVVLAKYNDTQKNLAVLQGKLTDLQKQNDRKKHKDNEQVENALNKVKNTEKLVQSLERKISTLQSNQSHLSDNVNKDLGINGTKPASVSDRNIPILGRPGQYSSSSKSRDFKSGQKNSNQKTGSVGDLNEQPLVWYQPDDAIITKEKNSDKEEIKYPYSSKDISGVELSSNIATQAKPLTDSSTGSSALQKQLIKDGELKTSDTKKDTAKAVYTIPALSTLSDATALTALVGRIPVGGTVTNPFRFQALIGNDNMASNGFFIPHLEDMKVAGYLEGDYMNCVRGTIDTITYIFEDGTIRTIHSGGNGGSGKSGKSGGGSGGSLGWISDQWGNPCIPGTYIDNFSKFLGKAALASGLSAAGEALENVGNVTSTSGSTVTSIASGSTLNSIAGGALSGGFDKASDLIEDRIGDAFDAVIIEAGEKISIQIEQELHIDYDTAGRKITDNKHVEEFFN